MAQKILVVDDEVVLVETIAYNLEQAGYQVITASDGVSALEAAQRENPDLIILDVNLPGMSGVEWCRKLRATADLATLPVALFSNWDHPEDIAAGWTGTMVHKRARPDLS